MIQICIFTLTRIWDCILIFLIYFYKGATSMHFPPIYINISYLALKHNNLQYYISAWFSSGDLKCTFL